MCELRPRAPLVVRPDELVVTAAQRMREANADAAVVLDAAGVLVGILTDSDVVSKVLAVGADPGVMTVGEAMTRAPRCVAASDAAVDALCLMVENRFRHLPVLDGAGAAG